MSAAGTTAPAPTPPREAPDRGPLHASLSLGRVAGVEIGINWSWIVIFGLIVWSLGAVTFPAEQPGLGSAAYVAMALVAAALFFTSLVAHELGHATVARREGMEMDGITLWLFGGVARFRGMFPSAGAEFRIAIAGPVVSLAIGVGLLALAWVLPLPGGVDGVLTWVGTMNLILLVFNMLPALPLDGGRVLRSLLWQRTGNFLKATRIAGGLGRAFGQAMIIFGVLGVVLAGAPGGLWFALIGWFLVTAARAETSLATMRDVLEGLHVTDAMVSAPLVVSGGATMREFIERVFAEGRHSAYPVLGAPGEPVGLLTLSSVGAVAEADWDTVRVCDAMTPLQKVGTVEPASDLGEAAISLSQSALGRLVVVEDGRLAGLLSITDVARLIELRRRTR